jgi:hypothetical protein
LLREAPTAPQVLEGDGELPCELPALASEGDNESSGPYMMLDDSGTEK